MPSHYSERDDKVLLYQIRNFSSYENLNSFISLAEYISQVKSTSLILTPAAFQHLAPAADFKSFSFPARMFPTTGNPALEIADPYSQKDLSGHPFLAGHPMVRFFAAIPLINRRAELLGYLTFRNDKPDPFDEGQRNALLTLKDQFLASLENLDPIKKEMIDPAYGQLLISSEEHYRKLFFNNPLPMWICDAETSYFLEVNQAAVNNYGYSVEEFLVMKVRDIRPPEDVDLLANHEGKPAESGTHYDGYWRHLRKNGELLYVDISSQRIEHGGRNAVVELAHDVTGKVKTEAAIKAGQEIRRLILDSALDAIICMETDGRVTFWNRQAEKLFGWSKEEMIGKELSGYILPEDLRPNHREGLKNFLETGQSTIIHKILEIKAIDRDHKEFPVELSIVHVPHPYKQFFCAFIRDITDRKQYISAIEDQNTKLREIAWTQSHVVRAPLSRIMGLVDIINNYPSADTRQMLTDLSSSAEELDIVVRDIVRKTELI
jgi:PAS domain S-box-containing protein